MRYQTPLRWVGQVAMIVATAVLYLCLGGLALALAIPPGYAMAIYPPAGLALAVVLIAGRKQALGVGLGSLLLNVWIGWQTRPILDWAALQLPLIIASGAILQALFAAALVRRFVGYPNALDNHASIFKFMCLGALLACCVNAGIGVGALYFKGIIELQNVAGHFLTWWIGDSLGVLIVVPCALILFGEPRSIWRARRFNVLFPMMLILVLVVVAFVSVREWEQSRISAQFHDRAQRFANAMQARIDYHLEVQKSVASLFASVENITQKQFSSFVAQPISNFSALQAIVWVPRVLHAERADWESMLAQSVNAGNLKFSAYADPPPVIGEANAAHKIVPAAVRELYFPGLYVSPLLGNAQLFAFDFASLPELNASIEEARDIGLLVASAPASLLLSEPAQRVASFVSPVYDSHLAGFSVSERRRAFKGVVVSVLHMGQVLDSVLAATDRNDLKVRLLDVPSNGQPYVYAGFAEQSNKPSANNILSDMIFSLDSGGRELRLEVSPSNSFYQQQQAWAAWTALVGGMLFTGIVGMYLLLVSGRSYGIEQLVAQRTEQLHQSEHRLHAILDNAADGILTINNHGGIMLVNRALCKLLGKTSEEISQGTVEQLFAHDEKNQALTSLLARSASGNTIQEQFAKKADGQQIPVELSIAKVGQQQDGFCVVVVHDLSERKRIEQLKGDFVSAVSHELRTPLTSIRGSLGLLVGGVGGQLNEQASKLLKLANENAERLSALINDLLDFEKLEYGGMRFEHVSRNLTLVVRHAIETNLGYAQKFHIKLNFDVQEETPILVKIDDSRMIQVLSNLLSNAIKFSHPYGRVDISLKHDHEFATVVVTDHGTGIAEDYKSHIFEKFSQADGSVRKKYGGTGLGLSLSKMMMEKMGGQIGFTSTEGEGASFFVVLPLAKE